MRCNVIDLRKWAGREETDRARPRFGAEQGGNARAGYGLVHIGGIARRVVYNLRS